MRIPKSHPRYESLKTREALVKYWREGLVATQGLLAHGRGEAFDYLIGERTIKQAKIAARASAALLLLAEKPVISVNGNTAALAAKDIVKL
ncbi:MAG: phosphopantothenate/pantothenate synthetase family protein, partial [Candidatus Thermoplasmatota archaeon]